MSEKPIAERIMAAWMKLQGADEDEIATHNPDSIEDEIANLEAAVRMKTESEPPLKPVMGTKVATATVSIKPVEQYPRWYRFVSFIYRRDAVDMLTWVNTPDGTPRRMDGSVIDDICRTDRLITEAEAREYSLSTCPDCGAFRGHGHEEHCPEAWVEISKVDYPQHLPRHGVDVVMRKNEPPQDAKHRSPVNGVLSVITHATWNDWKFVCLRKDLPAPIYCPDCNAIVGEGHEDVCPMAWVKQDRCDVRPEIDQVYRSQSSKQWLTAAGPNWVGVRHGRDDDGDILHVRCRRQDLPVPMNLESVADVCEPRESAGEGYRWLTDGEIIEDGDEAVKPVCQNDVDAQWRESWAYRIRRKICAACESPAVPGTAGCKDHNAEAAACLSPFGDAMAPPTNRVAVRLFVQRRVLDEPAVDYPVRCCWSQSEIKDVATWVEVMYDDNGFFIER